MHYWHDDWKEVRPKTREKLFDSVWKYRLSKLSLNWDVAERRILGVCKKYNVATPNDFIKKSQKPKLIGNGNQEISFSPKDVSETITPRQDLIDLEKMNFKEVKVPKKTIKFHPLIDEVQSIPGYSGTYNVLKIVTDNKELKERAKMIMDTLIKAIENNGGQVGRESDFKLNKKSAMGFFGCYKSISIWEPSKRVIDKSARMSFYQSSTLIPKNVLSLKIDYRYESDFQQNFNESKSRSLEERVPEILESLFLEGLEYQRKKTEEKWVELDEKKKDDEKKKLAKIIQEENQFNEELIENYNNWKESKNINIFMEDMKNRVLQDAKNIKSIEEFNKWYKKAKKYADGKDPLLYMFSKKNCK